MTRDNAETCAAEVIVAAAQADSIGGLTTEGISTKSGKALADFFNALVEGITTSEEN